MSHKLKSLLIFIVFLATWATAAKADIPNVIKRAQQSVVTIETDYIYSPYAERITFGKVFRKAFYEEPVSQEPREIFYKGQGSGVIIDASGLILTNAHVIHAAKNVRVVLQDKSTFPARVIGKSKHHDLALLRITPTQNLKALSFASMDEVRVGVDIYALGSPLNFKNSVSKGIVSALNRDFKRGSQTVSERLLQTDVAVNPGSSGGPIILSDGRMAGLVVSGYRYSEGIHFAIPIDVIEEELPELKRGKSEMLASDRLFEMYGLFLAERGEGSDRFLEIAFVEPESSAYKTGLRVGDIIRYFRHQSVVSQEEVYDIVSRMPKMERRVYIKIERDGKTFFTYLEAKWIR